jgi:hypothetical protein
VSRVKTELESEVRGSGIRNGHCRCEDMRQQKNDEKLCEITRCSNVVKL